MTAKSKRGTVVDEETGMRFGVPAGGGTIPPQTRRKGIGVRQWLVVSEGMTRVEEVGKHSIMRRTGLPARDLRALDPAFSYPSSILGRERAIVVNLEHIKAVITAKEVLMLNSTNPLIVEFLQNLQYRLSFLHHPPPQQGDGVVEETRLPNSEDGNLDSSANLRRRIVSTEGSNEKNISEIKDNLPNETIEHPVALEPKVVPFEFRALEACLESACKCLESETKTLEDEAYPALDELTSKISTLNLDRARQIKSRLVMISGRVQKVRDELEHLLDDDNDMAEMYLTEKLASRLGDQVSSRDEALNEEIEDNSGDDESRSETNSDIYTNIKPDIEELEMLLEAYFVQIDGILQKLSHMKEYVDDTEDFINIMLDDKQNQLLQMGVMLSTANMIINAGIVVVGLFGMNIHIDLFDAQPIKFWQTVFGTAGAIIALYVIAIYYGKQKNLIEL